MKKTNDYIIKGFALAGIYFISKYVVEQVVNMAYNRITYSFGRPRVDLRGLANYPPIIKVVLPMVINNKNPVGITVTKFTGQLFYGSIKLSDIIIPNGTVIPANGDGTMDLNLDITATQLIQDVISSLGATGTYSTLVNTLRLKGVLETSILRVPIETTISIV